MMDERIARGASLTGAEGVVWYCRECSGPDGTVGGSVTIGAVDWELVERTANERVDVDIACHLETVHGVAPVLADIYVTTDDGIAHAFRPGAMVARCGASFGSGGAGAVAPTCADCGGGAEVEERDEITMTEHDWSHRADAMRAAFE